MRIIYLKFQKRKEKRSEVINLFSFLVISLFLFSVLPTDAYPIAFSPGSSVIQEKVTITGTVKDETGASLPGTTIMEKGTSNGTITDANGHYSIVVAQGATLVISFVGMETQELVVGNQTLIDVVLKISAVEIEEVVSIGYGKTSRKLLTTSISKVTTDKIGNMSEIGRAHV